MIRHSAFRMAYVPKLGLILAVLTNVHCSKRSVLCARPKNYCSTREGAGMRETREPYSSHPSTPTAGIPLYIVAISRRYLKNSNHLGSRAVWRGAKMATETYDHMIKQSRSIEHTCCAPRPMSQKPTKTKRGVENRSTYSSATRIGPILKTTSDERLRCSYNHTTA